MIKIKKRSQLECITLFIYILPFMFGFCIELLKAPSLIRYLVDVAWFLLLLTMLVKTSFIRRITSKKILNWIICFFMYCTVFYIGHYQSIFYYLWGVRNNFRFYVFFFACIIFLKAEERKKYIQFFEVAFYMNSLVIAIQYYFLGYRQDYLGGIFGTSAGCNGYLNIFLVIVSTKSIIFYLHRKESIQKCLSKIILIVMTAAFAELKFFFVEFTIIIVISVLVTKFTWRKMIIIVVSCCCLYCGVKVLVTVFPGFKDAMSIQGLYEIATSDSGYTSSGDMNRLTALDMSNELFLKTTEEKLFGLGLGNCDYSNTYSFLTTPFFRENQLIHYTWLSSAFVFLETGYIGLLFFFGFYVMLFRETDKRERDRYCASVYCHIAKVLAIMCMIIAIYNSSLRTEAAYMLYFTMAIPFINPKEERRRNVTQRNY